MSVDECEQEYRKTGNAMFEAKYTPYVKIFGRVDTNFGTFFSNDADRLGIDPETMDWEKW